MAYYQAKIFYTEIIMTFSNWVFVFSIWGCTEIKYTIGQKTHTEESWIHFKKINLNWSQNSQFEKHYSVPLHYLSTHFYPFFTHFYQSLLYKMDIFHIHFTYI